MEADGLLFERKRGSREFLSSDGGRIEVRDKKQSFFCYFPTVTMPDGRVWASDPRKWRKGLGSVARGRYMTASIDRAGSDEPSIELTIAEIWSKSEVRTSDLLLYGAMDSGQYCLQDAEGNIVVRGGTSWRDSDRRSGVAECFWYDGHSCGDWWPALMLVVTQIGDSLRGPWEAGGP